MDQEKGEGKGRRKSRIFYGYENQLSAWRNTTIILNVTPYA